MTDEKGWLQLRSAAWDLRATFIANSKFSVNER